MMEHWFTLTLEDTQSIFDLPADDQFDDAVARIADELFAAGCDDGTFFTRERALFVGFAREAPTFRDAVDSAIKDVQAAGYKVTHVAIDAPPELDEINERLSRSAGVSSG